jgi:REP element-mobilizing transposase RayT
MPRSARLDVPGILHHVTGRGIERRAIFRSKLDRNEFIDRLAALATKGYWDVYAWVLMPNHFHLLVKTQNQSLAASMRKILTGYAVNFNHRHRRNGHLFKNRYKSIVCQEDLYLKELVRYIHLNLLRAKLVKNPAELNTSPWSGHSAIMGKVKREWQDIDYVLSFLNNNRLSYLKYVEGGADQGRRPELVGGGLIRSLRGWSEVEALTRRVCKKCGITTAELQSGSRRRPAVQARQAVSWFAVRELGYSGAEVARFLGVSNSCVTRIAAGDQRLDVKVIIDF